MKVQNNSGAQISQLESNKVDKVNIKGAKDKKNVATPSELSSASQVSLSPRAQDMKKIKELAMNAPDVDAEKVAKYQKLIDSGKYKVNADAVADKMVDEHLMFGE